MHQKGRRLAGGSIPWPALSAGVDVLTEEPLTQNHAVEPVKTFGGLYPLEEYEARVVSDRGSAGRDNPGIPGAPARGGGSGAASPELGSTYH